MYVSRSYEVGRDIFSVTRQALVRDTASFAAGLIGGGAFWYLVIRIMVNHMVSGSECGNPSNHSLWPLLIVGFVAFYVCYKTAHWLLGKIEVLKEPHP